MLSYHFVLHRAFRIYFLAVIAVFALITILVVEHHAATAAAYIVAHLALYGLFPMLLFRWFSEQHYFLNHSIVILTIAAFSLTALAIQGGTVEVGLQTLATHVILGAIVLSIGYFLRGRTTL